MTLHNILLLRAPSSMDTRQEHDMIHTKMPRKELLFPSWSLGYDFCERCKIARSLASGRELTVLLVPHVMVAILVKYLVLELLNLIITFSKGHAPICHTTSIYFHYY
jgi:hypothetical protein